MNDFISTVYSGNLEKMMEYDLQQVDVNQKDDKGYTALHWNCMFGLVGPHREKIAQKLIDFGAEVNAILDDNGYSPLVLACESGSVGLVKLLVNNGADVNLIATGTTPLIQAVISGCEDMVEFLIDSGADSYLTDVRGNNAANIALEYERPDIYRLITNSAN